MPKPKEMGESLEKLERPTIKWRTIGAIAAGFAVLWVTSFMVQEQIDGWAGWIPVGVVGVLSLVAIGFGIYIFRMTRRSQGIMEILSQATDEEGRQKALQQLSEGDSKDAMNALARAQLVAREDRPEAIRILEEVDIEKAPMVVQNDLRSNLALLYLQANKAKAARALVDEMQSDRQPNAKAKAMYAAVKAEALARTGAAKEALSVLELYDVNDAEFAEVRPLLLRAQVFAYNGSRKSGLALNAMKQLGQDDPNMLAVFLMKGTRPDVQALAKKALKSMGLAPKQKMRMQRR